MGKSAGVIGRLIGLTAQEVNRLLTEQGYLEGEPGMYRVTEKGNQFADEQYHHRGTGGYAFYNADWETRTWSDELADELDVSEERKAEARLAAAEDRRRRREERAARAARATESASDDSAAVDDGADSNSRGYLSEEQLKGLTAVGLATLVIGAAAYGYQKIQPQLRELWIEKASPRLADLKARVLDAVGKAPVATPPALDPDAPSGLRPDDPALDTDGGEERPDGP